MNAIVQPKVSIVRKLILPLFLVSGATALIYEVTWMRSLGAVFGNTVFAASTVLTAFMLGLAVGGWLFGKRADRIRQPLRFYAYLELAVGVYAFTFPTLLRLVDRFYFWFYRSYQPDFYALNLVRFGVSAVILLLPTAFMGGTLPILSALWTIPAERQENQRRTGQSVGLLYAVNTFGAVAGSFLTGYFLIRLFGVNRAIYAAAGANVLVGVAALLGAFVLKPRRVVRDASKRGQLARQALQAEVESGQRTAFAHSHGRRVAVLAGVFVAGFCALALEVLWTRILVFVLETSAYAFSCMLTCFIFGLALGSLVSSRLLVPRLKNPICGLGIVEFLLGLAVAGSIPLLGLLWWIDLLVIERLTGPEMSFVADMTAHFIDTLAVLFVPTFLMGMVFPIAVEICAPAWHTVGQRVGQVYAWNTMGCVLGAFAAGFLMVPWLGVRDSFFAIIGVLFLLAVFLILVSGRRQAFWAVPASVLAAGVLVAGAVSVPRDVFLRTMNTYHHPSKIVYLDDGVTGTVTVHDLPDGDRLIAVDGVDVAGMNLMLRTTQKLQAYVPLIAHEDPQDVVQIGYGSGETCGIGLDFGVARYTIVDICPGVFTAGTFFDAINRRSYAHPSLRKVIMDGKNFIKLTDEKFDIIMNDSTYPGTTGSSALYTYDHFQACRDHLKPGGVLSCWVPLDLRPEDFQMIIRSFQEAMPHSSLWMVSNCLNKHAVLLGTLEPTRLDFQRIKGIVERPDLAADLKEINIHSIYDFLDCLVVGEEGLRALAGKGVLHTDDTPYLEFGAAIKRDVETCWLGVLVAIRDHHTPVLPYVANTAAPAPGEPPQTVLQQYYQGTGYLLQGLVGMLQGDPEITSRAFEMARQANPQDRDIGSILKEMHDEVAALETAVRRTPDAADLRSRLAKRYMLLQQYSQAVEQYGRFLATRPDNAAAWNNLGVCHKMLNEFGKAEDAFEQAMRKDPGLFQAYTQLAEVRAKQADYAGAVEVLERLLPRLPRIEQARAYDDMARLHYLQKQYDIAIRRLDKAIELASGVPQLQQEFATKRQRVLAEATAEGWQP